MRKTIWILWTAVLLSPLAAADDDLAVIVNKSNTVDNLTKSQLRKIVLGDQVKWPSGAKTIVILRAAGQPEREGVLHSVCGMGEDDLKLHLMQASFNGDPSSPPKTGATDEAILGMVASTPGAIAFVPAAAVNDTVRAVTVDGVAAGKDGYKIKSGK